MGKRELASGQRANPSSGSLPDGTVGGNGTLVPTRQAVGTAGRVANIWLVNENLDFAESSQICGRMAAAALNRCPRKAPRLAESAYFPHPCLGGQRRAVITGLSWRYQEASEGDLFRFVRMVVAAKSHRQLQSIASFMLLNPRHVLYQPHLCSSLRALGNHCDFTKSQSPEPVPFLQHCCVHSTVSLAGSW